MQPYSPPPTRGRRPKKRDRIVQYLRQLIVSGKLAPGDQLPTHKMLEHRFAAESPTIRAVMSVLAADGFITTRHRRGSFVAPHPPHLTQFAFAFPYDPKRTPGQFYWAIAAEAARWQGAARRILPFYNIDTHADVADYQRLLTHVEDSRLAGLVFATNPFALRLAGSPLVTTPGLPRVMIETGTDVDGFPTVCPDHAAFLPRALDHLAARGCQRVAVVNLSSLQLDAELARMAALAQERGLTVKPPWVQAAHPAMRSWLRQLGRLLVQPPPGERPDGLVITDDTLVPELTAGLLESGVPVRAAGESWRPGDLAVVAHTNFPHPTPSAVPVTRLGYDITQLVTVCLERIDQQRRGETPPPETKLPALFEEEWAAAPSSRAAKSPGRKTAAVAQGKPAQPR